MRVLVLGVNGFIGNALTRRILTTTDWEVFGLDVGSDRIEEFLGEKRFRFLEGDIAISREWIEYHVKKCDVVLPLVAIATPERSYSVATMSRFGPRSKGLTVRATKPAPVAKEK